jgi:hypothetical protein
MRFGSPSCGRSSMVITDRRRIDQVNCNTGWQEHMLRTVVLSPHIVPSFATHAPHKSKPRKWLAPRPLETSALLPTNLLRHRLTFPHLASARHCTPVASNVISFVHSIAPRHGCTRPGVGTFPLQANSMWPSSTPASDTSKLIEA